MMNDARVGRSAAGPPAIKREAFWTSLVAMGLAVATTAIAQNEPSDKDEREPSWIVEESVEVIEPKPGYEVVASESALRMVTPLLETPRSVQVLNRTLIEEQELQNLTDALVNVSGVAPSAREELVLVSPIVRGFAADLFVDGLSAFALTAVADPTSMVNVEKVEVLKGPSGMLFSGGAGVALGGVINVVTRAPKSQLSGSAGLRVGEFETFGALFDVSVPLPAEAWSLRFNGDAESADSHLDEVDYERLTFNGALVGAPTDRSALRLRAQSSDVEQLEYAGLPASITLGGSFGVDPFRFSGASDAPPTTVENQLFTASWEQRLGSSFALTLEGRRYSSDFEEFASFPFFAFFPPSPESPTVFALIRGQLPTQVDQDMISPRVEWSPQGSSESVVRHRVLAGIEVDRTDYTVGSGFDFFPIGFLDYADSDADLSFGSVPQITGTSNQTYGTDALYVQDQISIGSRVDLLLGGRYSRVEIENRPSPAEDFEEFTPQLGLTVEITEGVAAFAGYSEGFRAPTFAPLAGTVEPERSQHREVGVKFGGRGGVSGTLAAYELTRTNVPTPDPLNPFVQIQTGEQRARGLEADVVWEPLSRLSILFAYAYAETEVTADNSIPLGDRLIRVPDHSGRIAVRYRPRSLPRLGVGLGATAFSSREITLPNLDEADGGVLTDFQASYRLGPMQIGLSVVNLLDEFLFEPYQYLSQSVVVPTQPRSVFASVRLGF